ncbi:hypothetical protein KP509_05G017600 [Ceratopteris richardii]|uniref:Uncharacterized protein n=1 Tax=Ceratopteris richardii TaxID=49495 RepID=A0A8T2UJQ7_CERRI|nr:hypothetical protein KP509_05G017600 [Ceratopteris richardii]
MSLPNKLDFKILSSIRQDARLDSAPIEFGQDVEDTNTMKQDSDMQDDENGFTNKRNSAFKNHEAYVQSSLRNAFEITLFCLLDEFSYSALDFIAGALAFEGKEYYIMQIPHNSPAPKFLQYFTLVKCKGQRENMAERKWRGHVG